MTSLFTLNKHQRQCIALLDITRRLFQRVIVACYLHFRTALFQSSMSMQSIFCALRLLTMHCLRSAICRPMQFHSISCFRCFRFYDCPDDGILLNTALLLYLLQHLQAKYLNTKHVQFPESSSRRRHRQSYFAKSELGIFMRLSHHDSNILLSHSQSYSHRLTTTFQLAQSKFLKKRWLTIVINQFNNRKFKLTVILQCSYHLLTFGQTLVFRGSVISQIFAQFRVLSRKSRNCWKIII